MQKKDKPRVLLLTLQLTRRSKFANYLSEWYNNNSPNHVLLTYVFIEQSELSILFGFIMKQISLSKQDGISRFRQTCQISPQQETHQKKSRLRQNLNGNGFLVRNTFNLKGKIPTTKPHVHCKLQISPSYMNDYSLAFLLFTYQH